MNWTTNTRALLIINVLLAIGLTAFFVSSFKGEGGDQTAPDQRVRSINLDKDFDFCGEKFPMDNWDVRQRLDAELLRNIYFHSQTILAVERAVHFPTD